MYLFIYLFIYVDLMCIHTYICIYVYVYIHMCVYIYRERERGLWCLGFEVTKYAFAFRILTFRAKAWDSCPKVWGNTPAGFFALEKWEQGLWVQGCLGCEVHVSQGLCIDASVQCISVRLHACIDVKTYVCIYDYMYTSIYVHIT